MSVKPLDKKSLPTGCVLCGGKYTIEKPLGQGSFGITYLATARFTTDSGLGRMEVVAKVAIKEFFMSDVNARKADSNIVEGSSGSVFTNYRKKFKKEAENLAKLSHSNIVRVFDVFDENGTSYYVMEFLDGENLDDYIKDQGRLPEDEALKIINEVGGALSYMHSKKMLHLDIKPKNVMRRSDSTLQVIDFGLSKQYTDEGEPESSTTIGLGTPGYAPIEQSHYKQDGTFPATLDVYALGATLFKMLTGTRPPEAPALLNDGFPTDELKALNISESTIKALSKAMCPMKKGRWATVDAFLKSISDKEDEITTVSLTNDRLIINEDYADVPAKIPDTLAAVWMSRNIFTNIACVLGIFMVLLEFAFVSLWFYRNSIFPNIVCASVLIGIVCIMYGKKSFLWAPPLILLVCELVYLLYGRLVYFDGNIILLVLTFMPYLVVLGSLYFKKNGKTAMSLMSEQVYVHSESPKWNKVVTAITYILLGILLLAMLGVGSNYHIEYYFFGFIELIGILFCAILIKMNLRMGVFLIPIILMLGYAVCLKFFREGWGSDMIVEKGITVFYLIELMALLFIKKDGKSAWAVMI